MFMFQFLYKLFYWLFLEHNTFVSLQGIELFLFLVIPISYFNRLDIFLSNNI